MLHCASTMTGDEKVCVTSAQFRDRNCFNEVELSSLVVFKTNPWDIDCAEKLQHNH